MAHFAELDSNNVVKRVIVVGNDVTTAAGPLGENDMHVDGETWCVNFFKGGTWKQTSYNNNFRKQYAGKGYTFDAVKDKFLTNMPEKMKNRVEGTMNDLPPQRGSDVAAAQRVILDEIRKLEEAGKIKISLEQEEMYG